MSVPKFIFEIDDNLDVDNDDNIHFSPSTCSEYGEYDWDNCSRLTIESTDDTIITVRLDSIRSDTKRRKKKTRTKNTSGLKKMRRRFAKNKQNKIKLFTKDDGTDDDGDDDDDDNKCLNETVVYMGDSFTDIDDEIMSVDSSFDNIFEFIDQRSEHHSVHSCLDRSSVHSACSDDIGQSSKHSKQSYDIGQSSKHSKQSSKHSKHGAKQKKHRKRRKQDRVIGAIQIQALVRGHLSRKPEKLKSLELELAQIKINTKEAIRKIEEDAMEKIALFRKEFKNEEIDETLERISTSGNKLAGIRELLASNSDLIQHLNRQYELLVVETTVAD